jgi:Tfp pilus assembly protein PilE
MEDLMPDTKNDKKQDNRFARFSLIELLTILILVGLIFIFVVPVNQTRISRDRIGNAIKTVAFIGEKAEEFKNNPNNGYYPDLSQLNLSKQVDTLFFNYTINAEDSTVVAETKQAFGKKGAFLVYNIGGKQYRVGKDDSDQTSKKFINENWLP